MKKPLRAVVVDDEPLARRDLCRMLESLPQVEIVGEADDLDSAAQLLDGSQPDLAFLDIRLAEELVFSLFERPRPGLRVVFVTAYEDYALKAFEVEAVDYLVKPVKGEALRRAVERAASREPAEAPAALTERDTLFVKLDGQGTFLRVDRIVAILADGDRSRVVSLPAGPQRAAVTLGDWQRRLPATTFARVHRSALVNMHRVRRIEPWFNGRHRVFVEGIEKPLTMSRRYAKRLAERFDLRPRSAGPPAG